MRPVLSTQVTGPFETPQPSTNWREPGASNRNTASLPIVAWASRLRLGSLPYTWLATVIWPSTMPPGRNGALIQLVLSSKQRDDRRTVVIDNSNRHTYNAKGQYRCTSLVQICSMVAVYDDTGGNVAEQSTRTTPQRTLSHHDGLSSGAARHHRTACAWEAAARDPAHGLGKIALLSNGESLLSTSHACLLSLESLNARPVPAL